MLQGKRAKQICISLFIILSIGCAGIRHAIESQPRPEWFVENQKESLYDAARAPAWEGEGSVNINTASKELLCTLPGIGEVIAERIIKQREEYGPFPHPMAIMEVHGIGEKLYEKLKPWICVE